MFVCEDMTLYTDLALRHDVDQIATLCRYSPSNSYYTVVASIFLVSTSCKAICGVASVRTLGYSQPFWLKLLMPHVLIKYAHVLICINRARVPGTLVHFIIILLYIITGRYFFERAISDPNAEATTKSKYYQVLYLCYKINI